MEILGLELGDFKMPSRCFTSEPAFLSVNQPVIPLLFHILVWLATNILFPVAMERLEVTEYFYIMSGSITI